MAMVLPSKSVHCSLRSSRIDGDCDNEHQRVADKIARRRPTPATISAPSTPTLKFNVPVSPIQEEDEAENEDGLILSAALRIAARRPTPGCVPANTMKAFATPLASPIAEDEQNKFNQVSESNPTSATIPTATIPTATISTESSSYVRFEISDFNCKSLSKVVPARHVGDNVYIYSGALGLGPKADILTLPDEIAKAGCPNVRLIPDWTTLKSLPWATVNGSSVNRVFCSMAGLSSPDKAMSAMPRAICTRLLRELRSFDGLGIELLSASELEFTVAKQAGGDGCWTPLFKGVDIFATLQNNKAMPLMVDIEKQMEQVGVDIKTMNAEYGPGQIEITFAPAWGVDSADQTVTFKTGVKEIAQQRDMHATFCSKPFDMDGPGNGGHFNFSLWIPDAQAPNMSATERANVGFDVSGMKNILHCSDADSQGLSKIGENFLAGILEHCRGLEALCSPTPACYTRHGHWAPDHGNWGFDNRLACLRVKANPSGSGTSCYVEFRMPSASASPYLIISGIVAAGLDGLQRKLKLPSPESASSASQPKPSENTVDVHTLPMDLKSAIDALEQDKVLVNALGEQFIRWYRILKNAEMEYLANQDCSVGEAWRRLYMEYI